MKELLIKLNACKEAIEWAGNKSWEEIYSTCHRGDWLLWLHHKTNKDDLKVIILVNGHCANTVRYLMQDERSLKAVDTAIAFGEGRATFEELDVTAAAAAYSAAYYAAAAAARASIATAATAADVAAAAGEAAADAAYASATASADYANARIKNQKETADIVRKYIPIELWNTQKMIDELKTK